MTVGVGKRVSWVELYFDLVFVFALTQVGDLLAADHSARGVAGAVVVFVVLWWGWVGTSVHADVRDVDSPRERLGILAAGHASFLMALAVPGAYGSRGPLFATANLMLAAVLLVLFFRGRLLTLNPYTTAVAVVGPLLLVGSLVHGSARLAIWALAVAVHLAGPLSTLRDRSYPIQPAHLAERFGLVLIIALGESLVTVGLSTVDHPLDPARVVTAALGYALASGLWWTYFARTGPAIGAGIAGRPRPRWNVWTLNYGHLVLVAGVLGVTVGLEHAIGHPTDRLPVSVAALLTGGVAAYLLGSAALQRMVAGATGWAVPVAAGCCLLVLGPAPFTPALATVGSLFAILVVLGLTRA